jgi:hypothetical protein
MSGYRVGPANGREPKLVVCVSAQQEHSSGKKKLADLIPALISDNSGAGEGVQDSASCDRVVVVGVLVLDKDLVPTANKAKKNLKVAYDFRIGVDALVPPEAETRTVVCKVIEDHLNMYARVNKDPITGLCRLLPLPEALH